MIVQDTKTRRQNRVRAKVAKNLGIPRLSVYRSNRYIWAQIIDDKHGKTLVSTSSKILKLKGNNLEAAAKVGTEIAKLALKKKISYIRFDRGQYYYHGRIKSLADAAREAGLKF